MFPDVSPTLYSRGFYLSTSPATFLEELPHFETISLREHTLQIDKIVDRDIAIEGDAWAAIIGRVYPLSTGPIRLDGASVASQILALFTGGGFDAVERALYDLGGRYAIAIHSEGTTAIYHDACATRSIYYAAGMGTACSHYDMLFRLAELSDYTPLFPSELRGEAQWDRTAHPEIRPLLANHRLTFPAGDIDRYFPVTANSALDLDHEQRLALVRDLWTEQLDQLLDAGTPLAMSMSGGLDSRTMLAMAGSRRDHFRSMTYTTASAMRGEEPTTNWARVMDLDYKIVKNLSTFLPKDHTFIARPAKAWSAEQLEILGRNSTKQHGRWILFGYSELFPNRATVHYRGNLLEIGRLHMRSPKDKKTALQRLHGISRAGYDKFPEYEERLHAIADEASATLGYENLPNHYDPTDMWYWEIRHSRWYAEVLNETDAVFDSVSPFNVRRIIDAFLAYDEWDRNDGFFQRELIYDANRYLTFDGFNEINDLYRQKVSSGIPHSEEIDVTSP